MTRPDILFVMTDDQTVGEMSCYGNALLPTPNMANLHKSACGQSEATPNPSTT